MSPLVLGDENVSNSKHGSLEADFAAWSTAVWADLKSGARNYQLTYEDSEDEADGSEEGEGSEAEAGSGGEDGLVDMEDMGTFMKQAKVSHSSQ